MENCQFGMPYLHSGQSLKECGAPNGDAAAHGRTLAWAHFPGRGRGLIACADLDTGTVIDVAPAIPVKDGEADVMLRQYVFQCRRDDCGHAYGGSVKEALVFGPMSLCNHSDRPNAGVCFDDDDAGGLQARLIARHRIAAGEEITIRYTDSDWYKDSGLF